MDRPPDQRIDELVQQGKVAEAASACAVAGQHERACGLYEQACDFGAAAEQARLSGSLPRALQLAMLSGDAALHEHMQQALLASGDGDLVRRVAADLSGRGQHRSAAALFRAIDSFLEAAEAFDRAGAALEAADCYEQAGQPADAARLLEAAVRSGPPLGGSLDADLDETYTDRARVALGRLYARHGRHEPAVRVLQQLAANSPLRVDALGPLALSLEHLGLRQALQDLRPELERHRIDPHAAVRASSGEARPGEQAAAVQLYGRYQVVREVATTPHARVLEAFDTLTSDRVAVKIFASRARGAGRDALQRFEREAHALRQLQHPNVVPLRDFVREGPAMVLAWMSGGSLRDLLDREPVSPARAAEIATALLWALAEAHRLGILHRDIKPSNLLFDEGGTAKLGDFGAAHLSQSAATVTAGEIGTVVYMSPEQIQGKPATVRSDLYSVGVLLHEMLTGARPAGAPDVTRHHPDLTEEHDRLLAGFLAADPAHRFEEAESARSAVEALSWPTRIVARAAAAERSAADAPAAVSSERLAAPRIASTGPLAARRRHDAWLGRDIWVLPCDESTRLRASAFARAGHPALPTVLHADQQAGEIWVEAARGPTLREQAPTVGAAVWERLAQALAALHAAGGTHGCVDPDHIHQHAGGLCLDWPQRPNGGGDADTDRRALASLRSGHAKVSPGGVLP